MPENLSYNLFGLLNQASTNDTARPATVLFELGSASVAIASNSGNVTVPTKLKTVIGIIVLAFNGSAVPTAFFASAGQPSGGNVTVQVRATVANGNYMMNYFLVGRDD